MSNLFILFVVLGVAAFELVRRAIEKKASSALDSLFKVAADADKEMERLARLSNYNWARSVELEVEVAAKAAEIERLWKICSSLEEEVRQLRVDLQEAVDDQ